MGLLGSILGTGGAGGQAAAAAEANKVQKEIYDQTRSDLSGYRDLGAEGIKGISGQMDEHTKTFGAGDMQKDAGYNFRMAEGQKALERGAASRGRTGGGRAMKEISRYGQNFASNEYNNAYNRFNQDRDQRYGKIMNLVGTGQSAAAQSGQAGQNYANAYGQNVTGAANAKAAAGVAEGNALTGLIGQGVGAAGAAGGFGTLFSDMRLKKEIEEMNFTMFKDVPTYTFKYIDPIHGRGLQIGAMAQDLLGIDPNHPAVDVKDGYYRVDYDKVERV